MPDSSKMAPRRFFHPPARSAVAGKAFKVTTVADEAAERPRDLVNREFMELRRSN
jgi:hypothetical protein